MILFPDFLLRPDRHSSLRTQKGLRECDLILNHEFQIDPFDFERHSRFEASGPSKLSACTASLTAVSISR